MDSYSDSLNYIYNLRGGEIDLRLERVGQALALFGHPEQRYPAFHVAGTNGKGSTAAMLHSILSAQGYRAGLYTSPHLVSFTERIRVGEQEISPEEVVELAESVKVRSGEQGISLTFFEFVTVMALVYFARKAVDAAVVEVGMGGRLDATNVVSPVVSVITTIALDHQAYLGSDIAAITVEKAGIIKAEVPVVCGSLPSEAESVVRETAHARHAPVYFFGQDFYSTSGDSGAFDYGGVERHFRGLSLALKGRYQRSNGALALAALEVQRRFPVTEAAVRRGLETVRWPGRFEVISSHPALILDGAHNGAGVRALIGEVENHFKGKKVKLLFAAMKDKDWRSMLLDLSGLASEIVVTRVPVERSVDPRILAQTLAGVVPVKVIEEPTDAIRCMLQSARADEVILVAGSLYLLGEVRPYACKVTTEAKLERLLTHPDL